MTVLQQTTRYAQRQMTRRLMRTVPWVGGALAVLAVGAAMRRKGAIGGALDTVLNALPVVGGVKIAAEMIRGRDFIRDRRDAARRLR